MSNIIRFPKQHYLNYDQFEIEELRQSVDNMTEELNRLNSELEKSEEPPKKEKGGWLWFALGAMLGLTW